MSGLSLKKILIYCGACIAFYIGAGFATMQEVMQYEASYGNQFWVVIAVAAIIYVYTNMSFINNGNRLNLKKGSDIYEVYCGKWIGKFYRHFSALFCYMSFVVMCGGASSTCMEQWGLPNGVGAVILAILVVITVVKGLNSIVKTLGFLGPVIIVLIIIVSLFSAINGWENIGAGFEAIDTQKYEIIKVGGGNPIASGVSYGGFVILWFAAFLAGIGSRHDKKEVNIGMLISTIGIFGVSAICCLALIANIEITWNAGVPALALANNIHPFLATVFAVIIFIGIYTSACPLLWTGIRSFFNEKTCEYKWFVVLGGILGCVIACFIPYRPLLNIIYGLNGYLGFILIVFMIVNDVKVKFLNR